MKNEILRRPAAMIAVLLAGILLLAFGIHLMTQNVNRYIETTAVISKIEGIPLSRKVSVNYTVDGRQYEDIPLGSYSAQDQIGGEVVIYYDPDDPSVIEAQGGSTWAKYSTLLGAVLTTYSIVTIVRNRRTLFAKAKK